MISPVSHSFDAGSVVLGSSSWRPSLPRPTGPLPVGCRASGGGCCRGRPRASRAASGSRARAGVYPRRRSRQRSRVRIPPQCDGGIAAASGRPGANRLAGFLEPWRGAAAERARRDDEDAVAEVDALERRTHGERQRPLPAPSRGTDDDQASRRRRQRGVPDVAHERCARRRRSCASRRPTDRAARCRTSSTSAALAATARRHVGLARANHAASNARPRTIAHPTAARYTCRGE